MKDRIRQIMESQKMTQQTFSKLVGISAPSLSNVFTGRTKPTLNMVEAIHAKIPSLNVLWLLYGEGPMYIQGQETPAANTHVGDNQHALGLDFVDDNDEVHHTAPSNPNPGASDAEQMTMIKNVDSSRRGHIIEIKVYYDDRTYDSFKPI